MRKRTVTTIEMHQIVTVRRPAGAAHAWCPACQEVVQIATVEEAALLGGVTLRDMCRRVGNGDIHLIEAANVGLVCLGSPPQGTNDDTHTEEF